jgi:hypothetical protein
MISWAINNNVISELYLNNRNIISPWGIETADSSAFFSLEKDVGYRYECINEDYKVNRDGYCYDIENRMFEGRWRLTGQDTISNNSVLREVKLLCLEDSYLMDFVMRFRFKKIYIKYAFINDIKIVHKNTNIYHQYPVDKVELCGFDFDVIITIKDLITTNKMSPFMYVRDNGDEWVVHVRMLPIQWDKEVIKLCNHWYETKPLPLYISNALLKSRSLKDFLWYHNEKKPYKNKILKFINPNAFPMVLLPKGTVLKWKIETRICLKERYIDYGKSEYCNSNL